MIKLRDEFNNYPQRFYDLLKIDESYKFFFIVLSVNNIGLASYQHSEIPALRVSNFIEQLNSSINLREVSEWCIARKYLPVSGKDFVKVEMIYQIGQWKAKWYGIAPK